MKCFLFLLPLFFLFSAPALARPVSYADGWMAMTMNDPWSNTATVLYSPTASFALGPFVMHDRGGDGELYGMQFNYLARRWNNPDSQGNFYLLSGLGATHEDVGGYAGIEADWEDRRYYVSYENRFGFIPDVDEAFTQKARIGIAPYVGGYGSMHTWLMLQADHRPEDEDNWTVTPLVRVFKGAYLAEAGVSDDGEFLFNLTVTY